MRYCGEPYYGQIETISDVWSIIVSIAKWPGDQILGWVGQYPSLAKFFELSPSTCGGWAPAILTIIAWVTVLFIFGVISVLAERPNRY